MMTRSGPRFTTTVMDDLVTAGAAAWLTIGLFVDGYAHENLIDTTNEDFFTPYHALFYSGFTALVGWVAVLSLRNRPAPSVWDLIPRGYMVAVVGSAVFGLGGITDAIWHQIFGVESGLDALLSPSHLVLMVGLLLLFGAPIYASSIRGRKGAVGWSQLGPGVIAGALACAIVAFFSVYSWGLVKERAPRERYDVITDTGAGGVEFFAGGVLFSTIVLFAAAVMLRSRFQMPAGGYVTLYLVPNVLLVLAFDRSAIGIVASLAGAVALELSGFRSGSLVRVVVAGTLSGAAMWGAFFATAWASGPIRWPATIWTGMITLGGITAGMTCLLGARPVATTTLPAVGAAPQAQHVSIAVESEPMAT